MVRILQHYFETSYKLSHHNSNHDRGTESKCGHDPAPGYGYRDHNSNFRDIMSYDCNSNACDITTGASCARVQRFSNTYHDYQGQPIGNAQSNCAQVINTNKGTIAAYFPTKSDEELKTLQEAEESNYVYPTSPPTSQDCKPAKKRCTGNDVCCSGVCEFRKCKG